LLGRRKRGGLNREGGRFEDTSGRFETLQDAISKHFRQNFSTRRRGRWKKPQRREKDFDREKGGEGKKGTCREEGGEKSVLFEIVFYAGAGPSENDTMANRSEGRKSKGLCG